MSGIKHIFKLQLAMIISILLFAGLLMAETPVLIELYSDGTWGKPVEGNPTGELDTEFEDSIYYFNTLDQRSLYPSVDLWSGVRFTTPADFILQGVRFLPLNQYQNFTDECQIWVYSGDANGPDEDLGDGALWEEVLLAYANWNEAIFDEEDYIEFEEGDDFWVIYGPAPGGAYNPDNGWWNLFDASPTQNRSKFGTVRDAIASNAAGDFFVVAGGEINQNYYDLAAVSVYNDVQNFFLTEFELIEFSAIVTNIGNIDSDSVEVTFIVTDEGMEEVFSTTVNIAGVETEDLVTVTADEEWETDDPGRFIVTVTLTADEDANEDNNSSKLLQKVIRGGDWYAYDDSTFESMTQSRLGEGWVQTFFPVTYPAKIDSASWYFGGAGTADLRVWKSEGQANTEIWASEEDVMPGQWNTFVIFDEENEDDYIIDEGSFSIMYIYSLNLSCYKDQDPPVSAQNTYMPQISYSVFNFGQNWIESTSGNWGLKAHITRLGFDLVEPDDGDTVRTELTFRWEEFQVPDPENTITYNIYSWIRGEERGDPIAEGVEELQYQYNAVNDTMNLWTVEAVDENEVSAWASHTWSFYYLVHPPSEFEIVSPEDTAWVDTSFATLVWTSSHDPDPGANVTYDVYLSADPDQMDDPIAMYYPDTTLTVTTPNQATYYWAVHALDTNTDGTWSDTVSFRVDLNDTPSAFSLVEPADGSIFTQSPYDINYIWRSSRDPDYDQNPVYRLSFLVRRGAGLPLQYSTSILRDTAFTINLPEELGLGEWRDSLRVEWWASAISGYDTVNANQNFHLTIEPGTAVDEKQFQGIPTEYSLAGLYPNPFNPVLNVKVGLPAASQLDVIIYNLLGEEVATLANGRFTEGYHSFTFDASSQPSGIYFVRALAPGKMEEIRKIVLLK